MPPSWMAVPTQSQVISASNSAPIGCQINSEMRSAMRAPAARSHTQPSMSVSADRYTNGPP